MKEKPSKLAALCIYASQKVMKGLSNQSDQVFWNATLTKNTGYKEEQLRSMAVDLL
jgi:hypothetical protein